MPSQSIPQMFTSHVSPFLNVIPCGWPPTLEACSPCCAWMWSANFGETLRKSKKHHYHYWQITFPSHFHHHVMSWHVISSYFIFLLNKLTIQWATPPSKAHPTVALSSNSVSRFLDSFWTFKVLQLNTSSNEIYEIIHLAAACRNVARC